MKRRDHITVLGGLETGMGAQSRPALLYGRNQMLGYNLNDLPDGSERKVKHFYVNESVGVACGALLAALHNAGLATLTHTPNPMGFLNEILKRPKYEKPYLLVPAGYPADGVKVPNITKKPLNEIMRVIERRRMEWHAMNSKLFIANIDLPQRQVTTKDLPAIP